MFKKLIFINFIVGFVFLFDTIVYASSQDNKLNFTYFNVLPSNQIDKDASYFDLKVKPNDEQTLVTQVKNESNKKIIIGVSVNNATTSSSGIINYSNQNKIKKDSVTRLTDIIAAPEKIVLKPFETKELKIKIKMPKKEFDGIVLGAIKLQEIDEKQNQEESYDTVSIENKYAYVYTVSLRENNKKTKVDFSKNETFIKNDYIYISFNNDSEDIVSKVKIQTILKSTESDKVINSFSVDNYTMAPSSDISIPIFNKEQLSDGEYITNTKVTVENKNWEFNSIFKVDSVNDESLNKDIDRSKKADFNFFKIILNIFLLILLATLFYFIIIRFRNKV